MPDDSSTKNEHASPTQVSFSQFVFLQYQQAKMMLGQITNPLTGKNEVNLPMAQYTIDVLGMLENKTRGNLDVDEAALLANLLHDLRFDFVRVRQESAKAKQTERPKKTPEDKPEVKDTGKTDDSGGPESQ